MTAATPTTARATAAPRTAGRGVTLPRVVAAEWTRLTSLRSTWWVAAVTVAVSGALTHLGATASSGDPGFDPHAALGDGLVLAQVGPLVLGVLVGAGEHTTGTFRSTFVAVPRRWPVLAAQVLVTAASGLLLGLLTVAAAVVGVLPAAASRAIPLDLTADGVPHVLAGTVLLLVGFALLGLAVGALVRRTVPALVTTLGVVLVLPVVLLLAADLGTDPMAPYDPTERTAAATVATFLPATAGQITTMPPGSGGLDGGPDLGALGGGLVLAAWVAAPLAAAAVRLRTRDLV